MLRVVTLLWDPNEISFSFSTCYTEAWVERLYRQCKAHLTRPFRFVCFTEKERVFSEGIEQERLSTDKPSYAQCIEPYRLNEPMILVGLDTIITGNIDHLAAYCETADRIALPLDPYDLSRVCNGVALVPAGQRHIHDMHQGENDMVWLRGQPHAVIDHLFPGHVVSYKGTVKHEGLGDARIVYFHGEEKPHQLTHLAWVAQAGFDETASLVPLDLTTPCNTDEAQIVANIRVNSARALPWLTEVPAHDGVALLCGGGPSLAETVGEIAARQSAGATVFALNDTARFLAQHGIVADCQIILDAREKNRAFLFGDSPKLLASQCHPSLFDAAEQAILWQPKIEGIEAILPPERDPITLIGGGIVVGLSALCLVHALGYREQHLFGYDSCNSDGMSHAYAQDETKQESGALQVYFQDQRYVGGPAMIKQAEKFPEVALNLAEAGAVLVVHGRGLLPAIAHHLQEEARGLAA